MKNAIKTTFDTDAGSELFKRTPLDLMKQHASLLTNILCLAITLSLVLVTGGYSILKILRNIQAKIPHEVLKRNKKDVQ